MCIKIYYCTLMAYRTPLALHTDLVVRSAWYKRVLSLLQLRRLCIVSVCLYRLVGQSHIIRLVPCHAVALQPCTIIILWSSHIRYRVGMWPLQNVRLTSFQLIPSKARFLLGFPWVPLECICLYWFSKKKSLSTTELALALSLALQTSS